MADKMTCPACGSHSSSVLHGVRTEGKCPFCGLSAEVMETIRIARENHVAEAVVNRLVELETANMELQERLERARDVLTNVAESLRRHATYGPDGATIDV